MGKSACLAACLLLAAGCSRLPAVPGWSGSGPGPASGEIHVEVATPTPRDATSTQVPGWSVSLAAFSDARPGNPGRRLGGIRATVRDMHATELVLDQDVAPLLAKAAEAQLAAEGFRVAPPGQAADYRLEGVIRTFTLEVAGRDELAIAVDATLRTGTDGRVAWHGTVKEESSRFAGVMGNSRGSIAEHLSDGVGDFSGKLAAAVRKAVAAVPPRTAQAPVPVPAVAAAEATPVAAAMPERVGARHAGPAGRLRVITSPPRARIHVGDVYYGLSPLDIELPAGIVQLRVSAAGYRPVSEKVSVRSGETTEWEFALEK